MHTHSEMEAAPMLNRSSIARLNAEIDDLEKRLGVNRQRFFSVAYHDGDQAELERKIAKLPDLQESDLVVAVRLFCMN
jgi:hypothetical protein